MAVLLARIRRSSFGMAVLYMMSATAFTQALVVLTTPLLARLYSPEAFGVQAVIMSIVMPVSLLLTGRYEFALMLPRRRIDAYHLIALVWGLLLGGGIAMLFVLVPARHELARVLAIGEHEDLLLLIPALVVFVAGSEALSDWLSRFRAYRTILTAHAQGAVATTVVQIAGGFLTMGPLGLLTGRLIGAAVTLARSRRGRSWRGIRRLRRHFSWRHAWILAKEYRAFPLLQMPRGILGSAALEAPAMILAALFGPATAGHYWLAYRLLQLPKGLIGTAVRRVFYQHAVDLVRQNRSVVPLLVRVSLGMFCLGIGPVVAITVFGPEFFTLLLGSDWEVAGHYAQYLALGWFLFLCNTPNSMLSPVFSLQGELLVLEAVLIVPRLGSLFVGAFLGSDELAIALYGAVMVLGQILLGARVFYEAWRRSASLVPASGAVTLSSR